MKRRRPGLFACVGLDLLGHPRALAAGEAMLTWFWALLHSRKYELDGFISDEGVEGLPKPADHLAHAQKLASERVQLFVRIEELKGWRILRFEEWNETAAEIAARRDATAARVIEHRKSRRTDAGNASVTRYMSVTEGVTSVARNTPCNADVPVSDSGFVNRSDLPDRPEEVLSVTAREEPSGTHIVAPRPRDRFAASFIGPAWAAGVAAATGGDPVCPTGGENDVLMESVYASPARRKPGDNVEAWVRADSEAYGRAEAAAGKTPSAWRYRDWIRNGRKPIQAAGGAHIDEVSAAKRYPEYRPKLGPVASQAEVIERAKQLAEALRRPPPAPAVPANDLPKVSSG